MAWGEDLGWRTYGVVDCVACTNLNMDDILFLGFLLVFGVIVLGGIALYEHFYTLRDDHSSEEHRDDVC